MTTLRAEMTKEDSTFSPLSDEDVVSSGYEFPEEDVRRQYSSMVQDRLNAYCNIEENVKIHNLDLSFFATMKRHNERYFLTKKNTLYAYNEFEYFLLLQKDSASLEEIKRIVEQFEALADDHVKPDDQHKSSDYCLIIQVPRIDSDVERYIKRYKRRKALKWSLQGYLSTRLILVEGNGERAVFSRELSPKTYRFVLMNPGN